MPNKKNKTVSTLDVDRLLAKIATATSSGELSAGSLRMNPSTHYGDDLAKQFPIADINLVRSWVDELKFDYEQSAALNCLVAGVFKNSSGRIRVSAGLLGAVIYGYEDFQGIPVPVKGDFSDTTLPSAFMKESPFTTSQHLMRLFEHVPASARLPYNTNVDTIESLRELQNADRAYNMGPDREAIKRWINETSSDDFIVPTNYSTASEYMARMIMRMIRGIAEYKTRDSQDIYYHLFNHAIYLCLAVRTHTVDHPEVGRLACDCLMTIQRLDSAFHNTSYQANRLIEAMQHGDLVYADALTLGRERRRIVITEMSNIVYLLSYLISQVAYSGIDVPGFYPRVRDMIAHTGAATLYRKTLTGLGITVPVPEEAAVV